jgi:hypothetical protein
MHRIGLEPLKYSLIFITLLMFAFMFLYAHYYSWPVVWSMLRITPPWGIFSDLYFFIWWQHNPGSNYPRIVVALAKIIGLNDGNLASFGIALCSMYIVTVSVLLMRAKSRLEALLILLALFSSASLLGIERGNLDLLMFCLISWACISTLPAIFLLLIGGATLVKIYPFLALFAGLPLRRYRIFALLGLSITFCYLIFNYNEVQQVNNGAWVSSSIAFGVLSICRFIDEQKLLSPVALSYADAILKAFFWMMALTGAYVGINSTRYKSERIRYCDSLLFLAGSCIYVITFLIASNFDYRLIFLILALPVLVQFYVPEKDELALLGLFFLFVALYADAIGGGAGIYIGIIGKASLVPILTYFSAVLVKQLAGEKIHA